MSTRHRKLAFMLTLISFALDPQAMPITLAPVHAVNIRGPTGGDIHGWAFALIRMYNLEIRLYIPLRASEVGADFIDGVFFEIRHKQHPFAAEEEVDLRSLESLARMDGGGRHHRWREENVEEVFWVVTERATIGFPIMWKRMKKEDEPVFGRAEARQFDHV